MVRIFMREARKDNGFSYIYAYKTYSLLELKRIRSSKKELKKIHIGRMCIELQNNQWCWSVMIIFYQLCYLISSTYNISGRQIKI